MDKTPLQELFSNSQQGLDTELLARLETMRDPKQRYILAITPRSGSSYLCDLMRQTKLFGSPGEFFNRDHIPRYMKRAPARTPDEYLRHVCRAFRARSNTAGIKTSWYQFQVFSDAMEERDSLTGFKYVYLHRRNRVAQAVSLYKATETRFFHTNTQPTEAATQQDALLDYDFTKIDHWYRHVQRQEDGWQSFFDANRIFPLCITYEEVEKDPTAVLQRLATYLKVPTEEMAIDPNASVFTKMADQRSFDWGIRYMTDSYAKELQAG